MLVHNSKNNIREVPTLLFFYVCDKVNSQFVSSQLQFYNLELVEVQFFWAPSLGIYIYNIDLNRVSLQKASEIFKEYLPKVQDNKVLLIVS